MAGARPTVHGHVRTCPRTNRGVRLRFCVGDGLSFAYPYTSRLASLKVQPRVGLHAMSIIVGSSGIIIDRIGLQLSR